MSVIIRFPDLSKMVAGVRVAIKPTKEDSEFLANEASTLIYYRTVRDGLDKNGKQFDPYSTKPLYIGGKYFPYATAAGGRTEYSNRRTRLTGKQTKGGKDARTGKMKSVYFQGGYGQFKRGLQPSGAANPGVVNLSVTNTLMGSQAFEGGQSDASYGVGTATEKGFRLTFTRAESAAVADGLIERGRDFWGIGEIPEEKAELERQLADRLRGRVKEAVRQGIANVHK